MPGQSNIWFAALDPANVPSPSVGYISLFVANGQGNTTNGVLYKKDSNGVVSVAQPVLQVQASDVSGLGSAATMAASAFDVAGAAAAAQAASQPANNNLTTLAGLGVTTFGMNVLTVADGADLTGLLDTVTQSAKGLMSGADKTKLDGLGMGLVASLAAPITTSGTSNQVILAGRIAAGLTSPGRVFRFRLFGNSSGTGALTFRVHAGLNGTVADTLVWQSVTSAAQVANQRAGVEGLLTVRSVSTVQCEGVGHAGTSLLPTVVAAVTTPTVATSGAWYITLAVTCSAGTFTTQHAIIEGL